MHIARQSGPLLAQAGEEQDKKFDGGGAFWSSTRLKDLNNSKIFIEFFIWAKIQAYMCNQQ